LGNNAADCSTPSGSVSLMGSHPWAASAKIAPLPTATQFQPFGVSGASPWGRPWWPPVAGVSTFRSIGTCGSAALPCGKARPFRALAAHGRPFGEAAPRRLRRSLNLKRRTRRKCRKGEAFPQGRAAEPPIAGSCAIRVLKCRTSKYGRPWWPPACDHKGCPYDLQNRGPRNRRSALLPYITFVAVTSIS